MQKKLTEEQISNCRNIARLLDSETSAFGWRNTEEGGDYWVEVVTKLREKIHHRTSDGKPYEPEPPIPEGWRKANADEWTRRDVKCWNACFKEWRPRKNQGTAFDPPGSSTRYIVPIDPPLTDQDACVLPRLLVMVRDCSDRPWLGPFQYFGKGDDPTYPFVINGMGKVGHVWKQARRATPEEIEAANDHS